MSYKLAVFDIDGTLTRHISSWQYIHEKFGIWDKQAIEYQEMYVRGAISYTKFCELDARLWKGTPEEEISGLFTRSLYTKNAIESLKKIKQSGFTIALISTGLQYMAELIQKDTGADIVICNRLLSEHGVLSGGVEVNIGHDEKGIKLRDIAGSLGVKKHEIVSVGDGRGDLPLVENSGYSIAFNAADPEYLETVDYICGSDDFDEVYNRILRISEILQST
jgi:phosphoserine phosphatase